MPNDNNPRPLQEVLDQVGVSLAEYVMLHLVCYETRQRSDAVAYAMGLWEACGRPLEQRETYEAATESLIASKALQIIDDVAIERIKKYLRRRPAIGPLDGLPRRGSLDFTFKGRRICRRIGELQFGKVELKRLSCSVASRGREYPHNHCDIFADSIGSLYRYARDIEADFVSRPVPIGPWRYQWWHEIPAGYRVLVKCR